MGSDNHVLYLYKLIGWGRLRECILPGEDDQEEGNVLLEEVYI